MATLQSPNPKIGNAEIAAQLAEFDYENLRGERWVKYLELTIGKLTGPGKIESRKNPRIGGLVDGALYDYEGYRAVAIRAHTDPDNEQSPTYTVGITLKSSKPEIPTRITAGRAKILNQQVDGFGQRTPGIFYLLKKVPVPAAATLTPLPDNTSKTNK